MRLRPAQTYRWVTASASMVSSGLLLGMSLVRGHAAIVVLATLGFGVMDLMLPSAWAMCMSLGGRFGGTATGVMNTAGNLGGWFCTVLFGYVVEATGDYNLPLRAVAAMVLVRRGTVFAGGLHQGADGSWRVGRPGLLQLEVAEVELGGVGFDEDALSEIDKIQREVGGGGARGGIEAGDGALEDAG